ncbi:MAG: transglutaminase-like cysteine peptidase [Phyllobacteriaceae bacterium]|nr:transglutaminase-like cysteine peptidase [Phyllobacteriaceae bacterium]
MRFIRLVRAAAAWLRGVPAFVAGFVLCGPMLTGAMLTGAMLTGAMLIGQAQAAQFMPLGGSTSKPYGHVEFCKTHAGQCKAAKAQAPEPMSAARLKKLNSINVAVNAAIRPVSDVVTHGVMDVWLASVKSGDCEDYALAKRRKLIAAGFSAGNLRLTMVRIPGGEAHIVLVVRTAEGDLVLDNLKNQIKPWNRTGYRFVKAQALGGGRDWVSIGG